MKLIVLTFFFLLKSFILSRNINIDINTPWNHRTIDPLLEITEYLSFQSNSNLLWSYLTSLCLNDNYKSIIDDSIINNNEINHKLIEEVVLNSSIQVIPKNKINLFTLSYNLKMYLPVIKYYEELNKDYNIPCNIGQSFIVVYPEEKIYCNFNDKQLILKNYNNNNNNNNNNNVDKSIAKWDYQYPSNHIDVSKTIILHGIPGSSSFCSLHQTLVELANSGLVKYIFRPAFPGIQPLNTTTSLQGYGVYLDIKNMEYKNADDKDESNNNNNNNNKNNEASEIFEKGEEVKGIIFSTLQERKPELSNELAILREELLADGVNADGVSEMKVWKMMDLGLQTTQAIISSADPVRSMNEILLNFPKHASSLSSSRVTPQLREAINLWQGTGYNMIPSNSLFINGISVDLDRSTFNIFSLIGIIEKELNSLEFLNEQKLPSSIKKSLISIASSLNVKKSRGSIPEITRVDVSKGGKYAITFLNNLEKDSMYKRLPKTVRTLLQPSWSLHAIQKNLYTLIGIIDPASSAGSSLLYQLNSVYQQQYPIRIGIALSCHSTKSTKDKISSEDICHLFAEAKLTYGLQVGFSFLSAVGTAIEEKADSQFTPTGVAMKPADMIASVDTTISKEQLLDIYSETIAQARQSWTLKKKYRSEGEKILLEKTHIDFVTNSSIYCKHRGLKANSFALNGIVKNTYDISTELMQLLGREQYILSNMVRKGQLTDSVKSVYHLLLDDSITYSRYHSLIDDLTPEYLDNSNPFFNFLTQPSFYFTNNINIPQCNNNGGNNNNGNSDFLSKLFNTTIIYFPVSNHGIESVLNGLKWFENTIIQSKDEFGDNNVCLNSNIDNNNNNNKFTDLLQLIPRNIHIDNNVNNNELNNRYNFISYLLSNLCENQNCQLIDIEVVIYVLNQLLSGKSVHDSIELLKVSFPNHYIVKLLNIHNKVWFEDISIKKYTDYERKVSKIFESYLKSNDETIVVYNGRIFTISSTEDPYLDLDYELLIQIEKLRLGERLEKVFINSSIQKINGYDYLSYTSFCGNYASSSGNRINIEEILESIGILKQSNILQVHPLLSTEEENGDDISLVYVIDPLTQSGQRAAAIIQFIQKELKLSQLVVFTPESKVTEFPLQNFYRFVTGSNALASFKNLPKQHTLTIRIDSPEAWNVQSYRAVQDIDNLKCTVNKCGDIPGSSNELTTVSYILKNLLIAGQCFEGIKYNPTPPNGLQLVLSKSLGNNLDILTKDSYYSDTLVMQNLGYFQLKANPGLWQLNLAEGRARTLYLIDSDNENILLNDKNEVEAMLIPIKSFADKILRLTVSKRSGMEHLSLLDTDGENTELNEQKSSMWNSISSLGGMLGLGNKQQQQQKEVDNRIHVFSLATGQVYERLLRIMMLSVVKRTSVPVKFWLFEYYLSPSFKATVTAMQEEYGFEVGYVMYKWPEWLTQQTVKQRIIWGYKILFLDVLFPLDVKKVIYVDADQVVRADLKELWDMDLEGKPYAYTPFCSTREETLGFQFWRQGYWADHLRGRPYHISALYVVDLQVFRQQAIGDRLRGVYDSLAKDPNSLANLDQDLPNYAQHVVPIHSLPQEWLWCETWCSEKSKKKAKTIDLCNNPLHKEPKLDMAKRVINGTLFKESWVELDEEIKRVINKYDSSLLD